MTNAIATASLLALSLTIQLVFGAVEPTSDVLGVVTVKSSIANIRSCPTTTCAILSRSRAGSTLTAVDVKGDWLEIQLDEGARGWVHRDLVELSESLLWSSAKKENSIEAYSAYLDRHPSGEFQQEAREKLREREYERAIAMKTRPVLEKFLDKYRWDKTELVESASAALEDLIFAAIQTQPSLAECRSYLERFKDKFRSAKVRTIAEPLEYVAALKKKTIETYDEYLERYPSEFHSAEIRGLREPIMFAQASKEKSVKAWEEYLANYPEGSHSKEAADLLEAAIFEEAVRNDWHSDFDRYMQKYPNGRFVEKAKERLGWLKARSASVDVIYPRELEESASPYSNVGRPFWSWKTTFKETGGKIGYRVRGEGRIVDPRGRSWGNGMSGTITREEVRVPAGGTGTDSYWFFSSDHGLCNSTMTVEWTGEDAGGHPISIRTELRAKHTSCPGPDRKD